MLIRDQAMRRQTMFYVVLMALLMLFGGSTLFADGLRQHPFTFVFYWAACGWLTVLSVLMAIFDILLIRAAARAARKRLEASVLDAAGAGRAAEESREQSS
jgi:hypothetical protein